MPQIKTTENYVTSKQFKAFQKEVRDNFKLVFKALTSIEATMKFYGDMFQVNKENIEKLDVRITKVESKMLVRK